MNKVEVNNLSDDKPKTKYDLFVSHSSEDEKEVEALCRVLEGEQNLRCVIARRDFYIGRPIHENYPLLMQESEKVLLIITPSFLESRWCVMESLHALISTSLGQRGKVIPVLFKPVDTELPDFLSVYTYIDAKKFTDLPSKIFEAFHNPVIVDGVRKKITKERSLTQAEIYNQNGARLLEMGSIPVSKGCTGNAYYFPAKEIDNTVPKEVQEHYELLRQRLNKSIYLRWIFTCSRKLRFHGCSIFVIGVLFLVVLTRIGILVKRTEDLNGVDIAFIVIFCLLFAALTFGIPAILLWSGKKMKKVLSDEVWDEGMKCIDEKRYLIVVDTFNPSLEVCFVRYDVVGCRKYTAQLLRRECPHLQEEEVENMADRLVKQVLCENRHLLINWRIQNIPMKDNRHNTWLDRECACELIARSFRKTRPSQNMNKAERVV